MNGHVRIRGAAENNLRSVDLDVPHGQWVAVSGVSGSGKSSLVYDVIYREAQRRFMAALEAESGAQWREMSPPRVDRLEGLAPALLLEQGVTGANPRSTVASLSGLYDYARLLYARLGQPHCLECRAPVQSHRFEEVYETALGLSEGTRLLVMAPRRVLEACAGLDMVEWIDRSGYRRLRIEGEEILLEDVEPDRLRPGVRVEIVVDRLVVKPEAARRLRGSLQAALEMAGGQVVLAPLGPAEDMHFAVEPACAACGTPFTSIDPALFSFNSAQGACPTCRGLGTQTGLSEERIFEGWTSSIEEAIGPLWQDFSQGKLRSTVEKFCAQQGVDIDAPLIDWPAEVRHLLWAGREGRSRFVGLRRALEKIAAKAKGGELDWLEARLEDAQCVDCSGQRLRPEALAVEVDGVHMGQFNAMTIDEALLFIDGLKFSGVRAVAGEQICGYLSARLRVLKQLGIGYLALGRSASSLSSGECQRLRLGAALESSMTQMLYVLDEPSAGLHARDTALLAGALEQLRDAGNSVLVVDHDRMLVSRADWLVDLGPGAGERGGRIVASGRPDAVDLGDSLTLRYLRGLQRIEDGHTRAVGERGWLRLCGARGHNLQIDQVRFPLGNLVGISGVSGSGKSSLVHETLYPLLAAQLQGGERRPLAYQSFEGHEHLERVVGVDQRPMGRSRRSNAATYTGLLAPIRRLYAELPLARMRAYTASHFSFNASQGACGVCNGSGWQARLQGEYSSCECGSCGGLRYRSEVLDVCFRDRNIADVLAMSVEEARAFFDAVPDVSRRLEMLVDVGLGYLRLGQEATSFSGGEAQRIKLAAELGRPRQGDTLYLLDEPTTGLHLEDVRLLQRLLQRLVDEGNTVVVVEHHIEFLAAVDWLIDLGPEGGAAGGQIVAAGTPRAVAAIEGSHTGTYLQSHFEELDG